MKKLFTAVLVLCMALSLAACSNNKAPANSNPGSGAGAGGTSSPQAPAGTYPTQNVNGIVQWGAGGGTDSLMRPLAALAEQQLGKSIVIQNVVKGGHHQRGQGFLRLCSYPVCVRRQR